MRNLKNQVSVKCEKGNIEIPIGWSEDIILKYDNADYETKVSATNEYTGQGNLGYLYNELERFASAVLSYDTYFMKAEEAAKTVRLIEQCYANRQNLDLEW